jgi:hypothetical protein
VDVISGILYQPTSFDTVKGDDRLLGAVEHTLNMIAQLHCVFAQTFDRCLARFYDNTIYRLSACRTALQVGQVGDRFSGLV